MLPIFHCSSIPVFHYSIIPSFHHSIIPVFSAFADERSELSSPETSQLSGISHPARLLHSADFLQQSFRPFDAFPVVEKAF